MTKKEISATIIMPTFEIDKSEEALRHILKQDYHKMKIIVVNDNPNSKPSDSMLKFIKTNKIKLINNPVNKGISESLNLGIKHSKTQAISILCRDYFPENKNWLSNVIKKLYSDNKIGCVVSPIVWPVKAWQKYPFLIRLFTFRHISKPQYGGGNYKKEVFDKAGFFNTKNYAFAGEDCDMHVRMKKEGYKLGRVEDKIIHVHYDKNSKLSSALKKEWRYGEAHGALKREYGLLRRIGLFDIEMRIFFLLGFLISFFINPLISLFFLLPFFLVSIMQTIYPFIRTRWLPGLLLYPFAGIFILIIQTFGAINGFIKGKQNK